MRAVAAACPTDDEAQADISAKVEVVRFGVLVVVRHNFDSRIDEAISCGWFRGEIAEVTILSVIVRKTRQDASMK